MAISRAVIPNHANQSVRLPGHIWPGGPGPFDYGSWYKTMADRWRLPRTLYDGTLAMRRAGQEYLPMEPKEKDADYQARLKRSVLYNVYKQTVETMAGKVFTDQIVFSSDTTPAVKELETDIDMRGTALHPFTKYAFIDALIHGKTHIFVDMPPVQPGRTLADQRAQKIRPYWVHVPATNVIGWKTEMINGVETLTQVRYLEYSTESDPQNEFATVDVVRCRVLERDRWRVFRLSADGGAYVEESSGPNTLGEIPFVPLNLQRANDLVSDPPLEDLASLNLQHWQSSSDQRNILHWVRVPVLFGAGFPNDETERVFGPMNMITGPEGATLTWIEHGGAAIKSGRDDLVDLEEQMRVMGLDLLRPRGTRTATEKEIDSESVNSPLQTWAWALKDALELAGYYTAKWMEQEFTGTAIVTTSFDITLHNAQTMQTLDTARARGDISQESYLDLLQRGRILPEDFDITGEVKKTDEEKAKKQEQAMEVAAQQSALKMQEKGAQPSGKPDTSRESAGKGPVPPSQR